MTDDDKREWLGNHGMGLFPIISAKNHIYSMRWLSHTKVSYTASSNSVDGVVRELYGIIKDSVYEEIIRD